MRVFGSLVSAGHVESSMMIFWAVCEEGGIDVRSDLSWVVYRRETHLPRARRRRGAKGRPPWPAMTGSLVGWIRRRCLTLARSVHAPTPSHKPCPPGSLQRPRCRDRPSTTRPPTSILWLKSQMT